MSQPIFVMPTHASIRYPRRPGRSRDPALAFAGKWRTNIARNAAADNNFHKALGETLCRARRQMRGGAQPLNRRAPYLAPAWR
jgi:hypothetical protein